MNGTHLSPRALSALNDCREDDLRLRTTLRRDDVEVWTSWLPVARVYETMLRAPDDVMARVSDIEIQTTHRGTAIENHEAMVIAAMKALGKTA